MKLDDLNDATGLDLDSEDYDSIGGYLIEHLEHLAKKGERITDENGLILIADKVNHNRIEKVRIVLPGEKEPKNSSSDEAAE